MKLTMTV